MDAHYWSNEDFQWGEAFEQFPASYDTFQEKLESLRLAAETQELQTAPRQHSMFTDYSLCDADEALALVGDYKQQLEAEAGIRSEDTSSEGTTSD